jgi:hypothetical protein
MGLQGSPDTARPHTARNVCIYRFPTLHQRRPRPVCRRSSGSMHSSPWPVAQGKEEESLGESEAGAPAGPEAAAALSDPPPPDSIQALGGGRRRTRSDETGHQERDRLRHRSRVAPSLLLPG